MLRFGGVSGVSLLRRFEIRFECCLGSEVDLRVLFKCCSVLHDFSLQICKFTFYMRYILIM
jgi:hypothetical protein